MIKLLRNPEIKHTLLIYFTVTIAAVLITAYFYKKAILFTVLLSVIFISIYLFSSYRQYNKLSKLSLDIDLILHGNDKIKIGNMSEGELGILQSEINKMTVRLSEQKQALIEDKKYLADSIADISHQLRTPLTSINLILSFLSESDITEKRRKQLIRDLYTLLSKIDWLITALLKISKLDAGTIKFAKERTEFSSFITKAVSPIAIPMELHNQNLIVNTEGGFSGDISWSLEAVTNIIKNCMEHTPDGGTIQIDTSENMICSEIIITDNGNGIDKADLPYIFDRFYKGKNSNENSYGIGLALARMIINSQNGTIKAENISTGGARFIIKFYKESIIV